MRIFLRTECSAPHKKDTALLDVFDPSFTGRYTNPDYQGFIGESHWEADKFSVFFLDIDPARKEELVKALRGKDWCLTVAEAGADGKPLRPYFHDRRPDVSFIVARIKPPSF